MIGGHDWEDGICNCDECRGVIWPSGRPLTEEERKEILRRAKLLAEDAANQMNKIIEEKMGIPFGRIGKG